MYRQALVKFPSIKLDKSQFNGSLIVNAHKLTDRHGEANRRMFPTTNVLKMIMPLSESSTTHSSKPKCRMRNWIDSRNSKGAVVVVLVALAIATETASVV
jgi:hypothetical protein